MRRAKRDKQERAFAKGFQAGVSGKSKENCPYSDINPKSQWLGGWREGVEGRINGQFKI